MPSAFRTIARKKTNDMTRSPRIAVIGCGYWGRNHIRTLGALGALEAVADHHPDRAAAIAAEFGGRALRPEAVFEDPAVDAVVLALPPHHHAESALKTIAAGKHLLVEKPIALTVAEARRIVEASEGTKLVAMTGHVLRFHPAFEALQELLSGGELGELRYVHSHRVGLGKFHAENDALWDIAPHDLSLILALTGEEPSAVRGEGSAVLDHLSDFAHLHLEFPSGLRGHVFTSRLNPYRERRLTVVGSKAMAVFDDVAPWAEKLALYRHRLWQDEKGWQSEMVEPEFVRVDEDMPLTRELRHFIECIETGSPPRTPVAEGLSVIRILSAGTVTHD